MKIEHWTHENVKPNGTFLYEDGAVNTKIGITMSHPVKGGCSIDNCHCSDGHWMCISFGYDKDNMKVSGVTVWFDNHLEMMTLLGLNLN